MQEVKIKTEYITLGQLIKFTNIASSGGEVKYILETTKILVNDDLENRRGKKLYPGDEIKIGQHRFIIK